MFQVMGRERGNVLGHSIYKNKRTDGETTARVTVYKNKWGAVRIKSKVRGHRVKGGRGLRRSTAGRRPSLCYVPSSCAAVLMGSAHTHTYTHVSPAHNPLSRSLDYQSWKTEMKGKNREKLTVRQSKIKLKRFTCQ